MMPKSPREELQIKTLKKYAFSPDIAKNYRSGVNLSQDNLA
jgi:hypothetical protein